MKKIIAFLLTIALLLTMLPVSVLAADTTSADPNWIQDSSELVDLQEPDTTESEPETSDVMPTDAEPVTLAESTVPVITPAYPSVSFEGAVEYNIYYTVKNLGDVALEDMGLLLFETRDTDGEMEDAIEVIPGAAYGNGYYMVHTNGIPAKNLSDNVYFKVYAKMDNGAYVYSDVLAYNAVVYAKEILADPSSSEKSKTLVASLLHYGAAAQLYFNYKTDDLMNTCIPPNEHRYDDNWTVETPATLTSAGTEYRLCAACGEGKQTREIPQLTVSSIAVTSNPAKTSYYTQESFDPTGMVVTATLSDGSSMIVTGYVTAD